MVLDCVVVDAAGEEVRGRGHLRINVNASLGLEDISNILQSYAGNMAKDLLSSGKAEHVEAKNEEDRMKQLNSVIDVAFIGVAK